MKKAITIYIDDCVDGIEEVCGAFVLHKTTGTTSVQMINMNFKGETGVYMPWNGRVEMVTEEENEN